MQKTLTLSIVIPVYNEENHLKDCLDGIARQIVKPLEVIVVDNNSTDRTVEIAKSYPFVKLLHEKRQGQVFAQAKGFNTAKGDILGRIDGDSVLHKDWVKKVVKHMESNPGTVAVSGSPVPYDISMKRVGQAVFHFYHYSISHLLIKKDMLWGANCAFRASAWKKVRSKVTFRRDIWEDYDLSFLLFPLGRVEHLKGLLIDCSFRAVHKPFREQVEYHMRQVNTYQLHTHKHRKFLLFIVLTKIVFIYPLSLFDTYVVKRLIR